MVEYLGYGLGIATFVFFIMIVVKMFQNGRTGLGVVTIIAFCLCGIGYLVALIVGWMNASQWKIKPMMMLYTICLVGYLVLTGITFPENYEKFQKQWKEAMEQQKK